MAPADGISSGQESNVGNKTASRIAAIDGLFYYQTSARARCEQGTRRRGTTRIPKGRAQPART
jgi:hypothetical protein